MKISEFKTADGVVLAEHEGPLYEMRPNADSFQVIEHKTWSITRTVRIRPPQKQGDPEAGIEHQVWVDGSSRHVNALYARRSAAFEALSDWLLGHAKAAIGEAMKGGGK